MKLSHALAVAATLSTASAINLLSPRSTPKVVKHEIQRKHVADPVARDRLRRRSGTVSASLTNDITLYLMAVTIGTPEQKLNLHIDTGSSDLWVNVPDSTLCEAKNNECSISGTYDANSSSTYTYVNSEFNITYADGSGSSGDYVTDTVAFGGATLTSQEFGVGYDSSSYEGILGIGYAYDEAILEYSGTTTYTNVPQHLVQSGYINSNAYSLWLDNASATTGNILFGGVDTSKFTGTLATVPIIKEYGLYSEFIIALTAIGVNGNTGSIASDQAISVLLDSGSSLMYLPDTLTSDIFTLTGAEYDSSDGVAFIDCDQASNTTTLDFTFSGATISVSIGAMVVEYGSDGKTETCILGLAPADDSQAVLGDTFLRSAYVVYDLYNNEISLATPDYSGGSSNILEITNSSVPRASAVASAVTTVAAEETGGHVDSGSTATAVSTTSKAAAPTAAIGYGAAAAAAAVGAGLLAVL